MRWASAGIRGRWTLPAGIVVIVAVGLYVGLRMVRPGGQEEVRTSLSVSEVMGVGDEEGFARAFEPIPFEFPRDHGPHPDFRTEWWYITGNLEGPEGQPFGFQFTIFRSTLDPEAPSGASSWATNQVYMGHLAFTDGAGGTFRAFERFSRGAAGLAGAQVTPFRVWLEDWELEGTAESLFPLSLSAGADGRRLELSLNPLKPRVLQGDRGLSQKGAEPGNASYYYSYTRLEATGSLTLDDEELPVRGRAWLDREWSTSALSADQVGWDWFALQLDDGRDLMYYQLRRTDGTADSLSKGVLVEESGESRVLSSPDVELTVLETWDSPRGGTYPSRWRLAVPGEGLDLEVLPILADQELELTFRYWEGAVRVEGVGRPGELSGRGYVELTGYADQLEADRRRTISRGTSQP